jgi:Rps23 Pro-64 3,4-dihydroxylase Tpa1-like proline 4-hydroxylase
MHAIPAFYFDPSELARRAEALAGSFETATPFRHIVLEDFVPKEVMELLIREYPGPEAPGWKMHGPGRTTWQRDAESAKLGCDDETRFPPFTRHFMAQLNSGVFLAFLERVTGIAHLIPDPTYGHCGLHSTGRGGRLMMHTDVNRHPHGNDMHQVLNLIVYVNPDWKEEYGGHLELWNEAREVVRRILPSANRAVLFHTGTRSLHGHPHPLTCPPGRRRNSLAVYYYLRERPASVEYEGMQHSVHWFPATVEDRRFAQERLAQATRELEGLRGRAVGVEAALVPFPMPADVLVEGRVPLYFLRPEDLGEPEAFARTRLAAPISHQGLTTAEFLAIYRPFALLGTRSGHGPSAAQALPCLVDRDGDVYVVRRPEAQELFWVGYLDEILASVPR